MVNILQPDLEILEFDKLTPKPYDDACITIGNFDGVHLGHQAIIKRMVQEAHKNAHPVRVITFYPNPYVFFTKSEQAYYLSSPREKEKQLLSLGVEQVITLRFDHQFAALSAETFLIKLKESLGLGVLVVGHDFALGAGRQGTIPVLKEIGKAHDFRVKTIPYVDLQGAPISSTQIRQFLDSGAVEKAAELLGRYYTVEGKVVHGSDRGTHIGLPTANIEHWPGKKLPGVGVYATRVFLQGAVYQGITNVGFRPTFENQSQVNIEVHILDFSQDVYDQTISLEFLQKIRGEQKFSNADALLNQIEHDKETAKRIFQHD
jgi:riboflavin kinase/FMN adenylyltransferase